jgi:hypothetical protein
LQGRDIVDGQERIVIFAETNLVAVQFLFEERAAIEILGSPEREERRHAYRHRPKRFVTDVKVINA